MRLLLVIDVGNTNTVIGVFDTEGLQASWRISTDRDKTADEYLIIVRDLLNIAGLDLAGINGFAIASVVPSATRSFAEMAENSLKLKPYVVSVETVKTLPIKFAHPEQIGADRLANSIAGAKLFGSPVIIIDFGTAITFDIVDESGSYLGGLIVPGIQIASEALFQKAALLTKVDLSRPEELIGNDTASSVRSGIINGYAAMIDGLISKIKDQIGCSPQVVATGGLAEIIAAACESITQIHPTLTLIGISILYEENRAGE